MFLVKLDLINVDILCSQLTFMLLHYFKVSDHTEESAFNLLNYNVTVINFAITCYLKYLF